MHEMKGRILWTKDEGQCCLGEEFTFHESVFMNSIKYSNSHCFPFQWHWVVSQWTLIHLRPGGVYFLSEVGSHHCIVQQADG